MNIRISVTILFPLLLRVLTCFADPDLSENFEIATVMLQKGNIDSLQWEKLEPFYALPLSVPMGEISLLIDIFPELESQIPQTIELKKYEPWSDSDIIRFFRDYPHLVVLKPILDFSFNPGLINGRVAFSCRKSEIYPMASNRIQFLIQPFQKIKFNGRALFSEDNARWSNRYLEMILSPSLTAQVGNFDQTTDYRLIYGFFRTLNQLEDSTILSNWLYGNFRQWNGLKIELKYGSSFGITTQKLTVIVHKRPEEMIAGFTNETNIGKKIVLKIGISGLNSELLIEKTAYAFTGFIIRSNNFKAEAVTVTDLKHPDVWPFSFTAVYGTYPSYASCTVVHYPQNASFPYSELKNSIETESKIVDTDTNLSMTRLIVSSNHKNAWVQLSPRVVLDFSDNSLIRVRASVNLHGVIAMNSLWSIGVVCFPIAVSEEHTTFNASLSYYLSRNFLVDLIQKMEVQSKEVTTLNLRANLNVTIGNFCIKPFFSFASEIKKQDIKDRWGFTQSFQFFNNSQSIITCDFPLTNENFWEGSRFEYKAQFAF